MSRMGSGFGSKKQFLTSCTLLSDNTRSYFAGAYEDEQLAYNEPFVAVTGGGLT